MTDIPGYEGLYQISRDGKVRSIYRYKKILKPVIRRGYKHVGLWINGKCKIKSIHRLVALTFLPNPDGLPEVNHIDGNKLNNNIKNLEWCTSAHNRREAFRIGIQKPNTHKLNDHLVRCIKNIGYKDRGDYAYLAKIFDIDDTMVSGIINGKWWKHVI